MMSNPHSSLKLAALIASGALLLQIGPCISDLLTLAAQEVFYTVVGDALQVVFMNVLNV